MSDDSRATGAPLVVTPCECVWPASPRATSTGGLLTPPGRSASWSLSSQAERQRRREVTMATAVPLGTVVPISVDATTTTVAEPLDHDCVGGNAAALIHLPAAAAVTSTSATTTTTTAPAAVAATGAAAAGRSTRSSRTSGRARKRTRAAVAAATSWRSLGLPLAVAAALTLRVVVLSTGAATGAAATAASGGEWGSRLAAWARGGGMPVAAAGGPPGQPLSTAAVARAAADAATASAAAVGAVGRRMTSAVAPLAGRLVGWGAPVDGALSASTPAVREGGGVAASDLWAAATEEEVGGPLRWAPPPLFAAEERGAGRNAAGPAGVHGDDARGRAPAAAATTAVAAAMAAATPALTERGSSGSGNGTGTGTAGSGTAGVARRRHNAPEVLMTPHPHAPYTGATADDGGALLLGGGDAATNATRLTAVMARLVTLFRFRSLLAAPAADHEAFTEALAARLQFDVPRFTYTIADGDGGGGAGGTAAGGNTSGGPTAVTIAGAVGGAVVGAASLTPPPPGVDLALLWPTTNTTTRGTIWEAATAVTVDRLRSAATRYVALGQWPRVGGAGVTLRVASPGQWVYADSAVAAASGSPFLWPTALRGVVPMARAPYHRYLTLYDVGALPAKLGG
ncbi:hypothetical protein MMPV_003704 [Pyropia vietnamensis]